MFSNAASNWLHCPTGYICLTFIHCVFSNVSSSGLSEWMPNHTGCTCLLFLRCKYSLRLSTLEDVWSNFLHLYGFSPMHYALSSLETLDYKDSPEWTPPLPFSQLRIISDENIWEQYLWQFHFLSNILYELKTCN